MDKKTIGKYQEKKIKRRPSGRLCSANIPYSRNDEIDHTQAHCDDDKQDK